MTTTLEQALEQRLLQDPDQPGLMAEWIALRQRHCVWPVYDGSKPIAVDRMVAGSTPAAILNLSADPALQLTAAQRAAQALPAVACLPAAAPWRHARLRIGYCWPAEGAPDVAAVLARHDRSVVEVYAFHQADADADALSAAEHWISLAGMDDEQAAHCIRGHEIDILVDLHGAAQRSRPGLLARRPAAQQVVWLGTPGPSVLPGVDYLLVDSFAFPPELAPYFTESALRLPDSFQYLSAPDAATPAPPARAACGLPSDGFVFCAFGDSAKITPDTFAAWMRILACVPDSVLWLRDGGHELRAHLGDYAEQLGVARARLVYAPAGTPLAHCAAADLCLDTYPFNGQEAAAGALRAGVPLLTCAGRSLQSRLSASLLLAADLPDLVTYNLADYAHCAITLAQQPALLAARQQQLRQQRGILSDAARYARALEQAYASVVPRAAAPALAAPAVLVGRDRLDQFDALQAGVLFALWLGPYAMSPERTAAVHSIFRDAARPVCFITDATLDDWVHPDYPLHPAYQLLSAVHRADYLRCYLMHHYGGGYTDIKPVLQPWTAHFRMFNDSSHLALGYPEISANAVAQLPGELGAQLRTHYAELIGYCSMIFRRRTVLTTEWMAHTHALLDELYPLLQANPAQHPMDQLGVTLPDGKTSRYPLRWTALGGNIFHPMILKYRHRVMKTDGIRPQLYNYR